MLKELTWHYVIKNPSLASMRYGQRKVIRELMLVYLDAANRSSPAWAIFPHRFQQEMIDLAATYGNDIPHDLRVRTAADTVATMTDLEALQIFRGSLESCLAQFSSPSFDKRASPFNKPSYLTPAYPRCHNTSCTSSQSFNMPMNFWNIGRSSSPTALVVCGRKGFATNRTGGSWRVVACGTAAG